jgi:hypothetical protein
MIITLSFAEGKQNSAYFLLWQFFIFEMVVATHESPLHRNKVKQ